MTVDFFTRYALGAPRVTPPSELGAEELEGIEPPAAEVRPQHDPLHIHGAGVAVGYEQPDDLVRAHLGARSEAHLRVQGRRMLPGGQLERFDRGTGVKLTGLPLALAPHDHMVAGEEHGEARFEHGGESFLSDAGLGEERPREAD